MKTEIRGNILSSKLHEHKSKHSAIHSSNYTQLLARRQHAIITQKNNNKKHAAISPVPGLARANHPAAHCGATACATMLAGCMRLPAAGSIEVGATVPYKPAPGLEKPNGYVTWSQMIPPTSARQALDAMAYQQYYDPYDAVHAAPEHFISGSPLTKFVAPDPSAMEISEFKLMQSTSEWRDIFRDFSKWSDAHKEAQYNGDEDITLVFR